MAKLMSPAVMDPIRRPGTTPGGMAHSGSSARCTCGRASHRSRRGTSTSTVLCPGWMSRNRSPFRRSAQSATCWIRWSGIRSRKRLSRPGSPVAITAIIWSAGRTGVTGSARRHAATSASSRPSICSGGSSPRIPMRSDAGFP